MVDSPLTSSSQVGFGSKGPKILTLSFFWNITSYSWLVLQLTMKRYYNWCSSRNLIFNTNFVTLCRCPISDPNSEFIDTTNEDNFSRKRLHFIQLIPWHWGKSRRKFGKCLPDKRITMTFTVRIFEHFMYFRINSTNTERDSDKHAQVPYQMFVYTWLHTLNDMNMTLPYMVYCMLWL